MDQPSSGDWAVPEEQDRRGLPTRRGMLYKRPMDLAILVLAHVLLWPIWALLWTLIPLAIRLQDRGPVFYGQIRVGKYGRPFTALKFRTMSSDAETETGPVWATADDPRVTRLGRFLRTTALDELPQVINILRGEMSFVGPRAERPDLHGKFVETVPGFEQRLQVRPGLTGLAQVNAEYDLEPARKLVFDLEYIGNMGLALDLKLLFLSLWYTLMARWDRPKRKSRGESQEVEADN